MKSFSIGTLSFITNNVVNPNFILQTPITGLDFPEIRTNYYSRAGQDGGIVSSMFYDKRSIQLTGIIYANDPTTFEQSRQALATACQISKDSSGYPVPIKVSFTTLANNSYFFNAYIDRPVYDYKDPNYSTFMVTMTATNSFLQGATQVVSSAIVRASGGGFILPVILPITSSAGVGGTGSVTNSGTAPAYPILTLTGPLTNPYIQNSTVGKFMQLNRTIAAGEVVTIDMYNKTILLNGSSSLISSKSSTSDWWYIAPGTNTITLSTASTSDTGNVALSFYSAYLGV